MNFEGIDGREARSREVEFLERQWKSAEGIASC